MTKLAIRIVSDMHLEFVKSKDMIQFLHDHIPETEQDSETVLVLAGDILSFHKPTSYVDLLEHTRRFRAVIYCAGNHEWYDGVFPISADVFRQKTAKYPNFYFLNGKMVTIDDVVFIGATLWTDFNRNDPQAKQIAHSYMNDYDYIETEDSYLTPDDVYRQHKIDLEAIEELLYLAEGSKRVVVTHHGPSMQSVPPRFQNSGLSNYSFNSDLSEFILTYQPEVWIHGHTHTPVQYEIGTTAVWCNPVGYQKYMTRFKEDGTKEVLPENLDFNKHCLVYV
jgi:Icc-related predicted phosphoesterase